MADIRPPDDVGWCSRKPTITRVLRQIAGQYWQKSELFSTKKICHHKKMSTFAKDFLQFVRELSVECNRAGLVLSTDNYKPEVYNTCYNLKEQAVFVDYEISVTIEDLKNITKEQFVD